MFVIHKASIEDIEKIIDLRLGLLRELGKLNSVQEEDLLADATRAYLQSALSDNRFISYIAEKGGEPVSISGLVYFERPPHIDNLKGIEAYILNMYTLPESRGNGLARRLLEQCINESKERGVKRIWLHATDEGEPLYKKMGFSKKGTEMELFL